MLGSLVLACVIGAVPAAGDPADPAAPESPPAPAAPAPLPSVDLSAEEPLREEVVVTAVRIPRAPGSVHVLGDTQLARFELDDPHAILVAVPGVYVRGEDGFGLRPNIGVRGVNPDRSKKLTLLEDGIPFAPATYSAPAAYFFPLMTRITEVRVIKGPAAITHGPHTVGGTVDLISRPIPTELTGTLDSALGVYGYGKLDGYVGWSNRRGGVLLEGVQVRSSGFKELDGGGDTGFVRNEWMAKGSFLVVPLHELRLKLSYSDEDSDETYLGLTDEDLRETPYRRYGASRMDHMVNDRQAVSVTYVARPRPRLLVETDLYYSRFDRVWRKVNRFRGESLSDVLANPTSAQNAIYYAVLTGEADSASPGEAIMIGPNDRQFTTYGAQSRMRWEWVGRLDHKLEVGARFHHDQVRRHHSEDAFLMVQGELVPEGTETAITADNRASTDALAVHAVDAATWCNLTVTGGLRFELIHSDAENELDDTESARSAHAFLPGLGLYYAFTDELGALAGAYRGFSPPEPGSEDHVSPELSINYEAGFRYTGVRERRARRFELIGFWNDYSNLTDVCTLSSGCLDADLDRQFDAGEARIYGAEAFASEELRLGPVLLPMGLSYTYTATEFLTSFSSQDPIFGEVEAGDEMPYVPEHQLSVHGGVEGSRWGINGRVTYSSAMREEAGSEPFDESLVTDDSLNVEAGAWVRPVHWAQAYVNLRNLTDDVALASRRPYGARPSAPRWVQVGLKLSY